MSVSFRHCLLFPLYRFVLLCQREQADLCHLGLGVGLLGGFRPVAVFFEDAWHRAGVCLLISVSYNGLIRPAVFLSASAPRLSVNCQRLHECLLVDCVSSGIWRDDRSAHTGAKCHSFVFIEDLALSQLQGVMLWVARFIMGDAPDPTDSLSACTALIFLGD